MSVRGSGAVRGDASREPRAGEGGPRLAQVVGIGCLTIPAGFFGGGMLGIFVGMLIGNARGCVPPEGMPICDTWTYGVPGMLAGVVLLPAASLWLLSRGRRAPRNST